MEFSQSSHKVILQLMDQTEITNFRLINDTYDSC